MNRIVKIYLQPSFVITVLLLASFAGAISYYKATYGVALIKKALPLKQPLDMLSEAAIEPYTVLNKAEITNKDVLESLGTEEYIQWLLEDSSADALSPVKHCTLFITYYTGNPDQVPHVPEACYTGGGHVIEDSFTAEMDLSDANDPDGQLPETLEATGLVFSKKGAQIWQVEKEFPVIYFFKVNGEYHSGRTATRLALGDLTSEYSYFSKVEISFSNLKTGIYPDKKQAEEATAKLLTVLLPVLEKDHWPQWKD